MSIRGRHSSPFVDDARVAIAPRHGRPRPVAAARTERSSRGRRQRARQARGRRRVHLAGAIHQGDARRRRRRRGARARRRVLSQDRAVAASRRATGVRVRRGDAGAEEADDGDATTRAGAERGEGARGGGEGFVERTEATGAGGGGERRGGGKWRGGGDRGGRWGRWRRRRRAGFGGFGGGGGGGGVGRVRAGRRIDRSRGARRAAAVGANGGRDANAG